jgi:type II secretion system protein J
MSNRTKPNLVSRWSRGFTLLEVLVATAIFVVLVGALYSLLYGALRLREKAYEVTEAGLPKDYVALLIKRDLANIAAPVALLAGPMIGEKDEQGEQRLDRLELHTTSGIVNDTDPWGDVQKVEYYIAQAREYGESEGNELVRAVTRNLLASTMEEPEEEWLLSGVQSLEFAYYDGEYWQDVWDSTTQENETPLAVRMHMEFVPPEEGERERRPIDLICEIVTKAVTEEEQGDGEASLGTGGSGTGPESGSPAGGRSV